MAQNRASMWLCSALLLFLSHTNLYAQGGVCGDAPIVEDGRLKGEVDGKARLLSGFIGDAQLKGQVDVAKQDVLSRYPNADRLRLNQYFLYVVCVAIMADRQMATTEKINEIRRARDSIFPEPARVSQVRIESEGMWIGNRSIGDVRAASSTIEFHIDGEYETEMSLSEAFDGFDKELQHGPHTFTYKVDIKAVSGIRVRGSCSVVFNVTGRQIFNPHIEFEPYDVDRGKISRCSLMKPD